MSRKKRTHSMNHYKKSMKARAMSHLSRWLSAILLVGMLLNQPIDLQAATDILDWRVNDLMDINLSLINNKGGPNDLFFELKSNESGTYTLEYYLEDGRKTTVTFKNAYDKLDIAYKVQQYDSANPSTPQEITQTLVTNSYLEVDYSGTPKWVYDGTKIVDPITQTLNYSIERDDSNPYPGIAINVDNKKLIVKWGFNEGIIYFYFDQYKNGYIMPVTVTSPTGKTQTIEALKGLEEFVVKPNHLSIDPGNPSQNIEVTPIEWPNTNADKAGGKPGLTYTFRQPKSLGPNWSYTYGSDLSNVTAVFELDNIANNKYLDFNMKLQDDTNPTSSRQINELPAGNSAGVEYSYDPVTHEYKVVIVKDKTPLAAQGTVIQWADLESSSIYNTSIHFQFQPGTTGFEVGRFLAKSRFAYTYLEYELRRADKTEAFLKIKPYNIGENDEIEYKILYSKVIKPELDTIDDLWLKHYQSGEESGDTINIPVPFKEGSFQDVYQVVVTFTGQELKSQVLNYIAKNDNNIPPSTPVINSIDNVYVVPPLTPGNKDPEKIQFDLIWTALTNKDYKELDEVFENLNGNANDDHLYYEVLVNDIKETDVPTNPFQVFRVYEVYKTGTDYKLRVYDNLNPDQPSEVGNFTTGYNQMEELLRMDKIGIFENGTWSNSIKTTYDELNFTYAISPETTETEFEFPGVNYLRVRAIAVKDGVASVSGYSVAKSLSLSMKEYNIPIVEEIKYKPFYTLTNKEEVGVELIWDSVSIQQYESFMVEPINKRIDNITYKVYLSEDKNALLKLKPNDVGYTEIIATVNDECIVNSTNLNLLREKDSAGLGNVIFYQIDRTDGDTAELHSKIHGLDKNKNYYTRIVVVANVIDNVSADIDKRLGNPSEITSVTTPLVPDEPDPNEEVPLAPEDFEVEFAEGSTSTAKLTWKMPKGITIAQDTFGFEVVAIEDFRLPDSLNSKLIHLSDIRNSNLLQDKKVEMWRIFYDTGKVVARKYDKDTAAWVDVDPTLFGIEDNLVTLYDDKNGTNTVNYYYVRTINVKAGEEVKASNFVEGTLTTSQVRGPRDLIVDYETYPYNRKTQAVIRFDAPFSPTANLLTDYTIQVYIKGETDQDYVLAQNYSSSNNKEYMAELLSIGQGPVGYSRLYYQLSNLKSGKEYYIKVRIVDKTKLIETLPDGSQQYPVSPFSNRVKTRTDFDQVDYDKELKYKQYIEYYMKKAGELKQKPYHVLKLDDQNSVVKYRAEYVDGLILAKQNSSYELISFDQKTNVYYLPKDMIKLVNEHNVSLTMNQQEQFFNLKPDSIGVGITKEVNTVVEKIRTSTTLKDYYIKLTVNVGQYSTKINGLNPTSPLVDIRAEVVATKNGEQSIEIKLDNDINNSIAYGKGRLIYELDKELDKGIDTVKLTNIVQNILTIVNDDFRVKANYTFGSELTNSNYPIALFNKDYEVGIKPNRTGGLNEIYTNVGSASSGWVKTNSTYYGGKWLVMSKKPAAYIGVSPSGGADLSNVYNQMEIDLINKYKLNQVFSDSELKSATAVLVNQQMVGAFARLLGATADSANYEYLAGQGIAKIYLNNYSNSTRQDISYLFTQVYCRKRGINLNSVVIKDYNSVDDINQVKPEYRNTILKGVAIQALSLPNQALRPNDGMTIREFIKLLGNVER